MREEIPMHLKKLRVVCISVLLSLALASPAYAQAASYGPGTIGIQESRLREWLGSGWTVKGRYALDKNTGEIYFAPDGDAFIAGQIGTDGCYYRADGTLANSLTYIRDKYLDAYNSLAADDELIFDSGQEANLFICWIQFERATSQGLAYMSNRKSDGTVAIKKSELQKLESDMVKDGAYQNAICQIAGLIPSDYTIVDKVDYATVQTAKALAYDKDYEKKSMEEAVRDKKGVCYHYAMLLHAVLSELAIESEFVIGYGDRSGATHVWLKIYDPEQNKWIYRDPTKTSADLQAGLFTVNIYEAYLNSYRMMNIRQDSTKWRS